MSMMEVRQRVWPEFLMGTPGFHPLVLNSYPTSLKKTL